MAKQFIYIDDSGDPGFNKTSSDNFIIAAVVIVGQKTRDELEQAIIDYRQRLGWGERKELKFHKTSKKDIRSAIRAVSSYDYTAYAMVLDKTHLNRKLLLSHHDESIMIYIIKELLQLLAASHAEIIIDGSYGPKFIKQTRPYLRKCFAAKGVYECRIRFSDSRNSALIQLADLVAGSVARSLTTKSDAGEYIKLFGKKIKKIYYL